MGTKTRLAVASGLVLAGFGWWVTRPVPMDAHMTASGGGLPRAMTSTFMAGVADGAPIVAPKQPATLSATAKMGKRAFESKCMACHGANAAGIKGAAPPLVHKIYEPSHHADYSFVLAVQNGVRAHHWPFGDMAPVPGLTQGDVKTITAYVRELQQANGIN